MRLQSTRYSTVSRRDSRRGSGITLIEVIAGLALMATLLTAILVLKSQVARQLRASERRRATLAAADELLSNWWQNPATFPRAGGGAAPGGFAWRTRPVTNIPAASAGGQVIRLEVSDTSSADVPPAVVEVVLPIAPIAGKR